MDLDRVNGSVDASDAVINAGNTFDVRYDVYKNDIL